MSIERMVMAFAGSFILISGVLPLLFSPYRLLFTAFVGANRSSQPLRVSAPWLRF